MRTVFACLFCVLIPSLVPAATGYYVHNLVADTAGVADFTDPNLVNAWGLVASATSPFWTCDAGTGLSTVYAVSNSPTAAPMGTPNANVKPTVPGPGSNPNGTCTGIVANGNANAFLFSSPTVTTPRPASFIFATEEGTIDAWASAIDAAHAIVLVDNSKTASYKGLAIVTAPTPMLYAANFKTGAIDVFDTDYKPVTLAAGAFTDPTLPAGYAPFNIWNLGGTLYVTYAKQNEDKDEEVIGTGNGLLDAYDANGKFLKRLVSNGVGIVQSPLNAPWGMAIAPATFGKFANDILVGNFGDGKINAFDPNTDQWMGALQDGDGKDIVIAGLWGLYVGNGANGGDKDTLYFTAGPGGEMHGLLGSIQANPNVAAADVTNAAQPTAGIAANTYVTIKGTNLAATRRLWKTSDFEDNKLPSSLDDVTVTLNGEKAYIYYISPVQINILTPADLTLSGPIQVQVSNHGLTSATLSATASATAPAFFLPDGTHIAATHGNGSLIGTTGTATPAAPGETIVLYGNGFGATNPPAPNGQIISTPAQLVTMPTILVNNTAAKVVYAGLTGTGLYQFNVTLPSTLPDGDVPVVAQVGGVNTPAGASIQVKNP